MNRIIDWWLKYLDGMAALIKGCRLSNYHPYDDPYPDVSSPLTKIKTDYKERTSKPDPERGGYGF